MKARFYTQFDYVPAAVKVLRSLAVDGSSGVGTMRLITHELFVEKAATGNSRYRRQQLKTRQATIILAAHRDEPQLVASITSTVERMELVRPLPFQVESVWRVVVAYSALKRLADEPDRLLLYGHGEAPSTRHLAARSAERTFTYAVLLSDSFAELERQGIVAPLFSDSPGVRGHDRRLRFEAWESAFVKTLRATQLNVRQIGAILGYSSLASQAPVHLRRVLPRPRPDRLQTPQRDGHVPEVPEISTRGPATFTAPAGQVGLHESLEIELSPGLVLHVPARLIVQALRRELGFSWKRVEFTKEQLQTVRDWARTNGYQM